MAQQLLAFRIAACALAFAAATASAQLAELVPKYMPIAAKARQAVLEHPALAPFEIDLEIENAITALALVAEGPNLYSRKRAALAPFEAKLGPVMEIPSIRLHTTLGGIASEEGLQAERLPHAAYAVALLKSLVGDVDGGSAAKAYQAVCVEDEYGFFRLMGIRVQPSQRASVTVQGRNYDVWTLRSAVGEERKLWFDVTASMDASERVLKSRMRESPKTK